jgi:hypothetical protein
LKLKKKEGGLMARSKKLSPAARLAVEQAAEVARQDMAIGLSGFFRVINRNAVRREVKSCQAWNGGTVTIRGVECDDGDLSVLLSILSLSLQQEGGVLQAGRNAPAGLVTDTRHENTAMDAMTFQLCTTQAAICRGAGVGTGGSGWAAVKDSLERLATLVVAGEAPGCKRYAVTHLIQHGYAEDGKVRITLSMRLTRALLGEGSYAAVQMPKYRQLATPTGRILFTWFASWYGGSSGHRAIGMDTLEMHAYGNNATARSTRCRRQKDIRTACQNIVATGEYRVEWKDNIAHVSRRVTSNGGTKDFQWRNM